VVEGNKSTNFQISKLPISMVRFANGMKNIDKKYFRENGTKIYLCESPNDEAKRYYRNMIREL
jgi:hypothetical protein